MVCGNTGCGWDILCLPGLSQPWHPGTGLGMQLPSPIGGTFLPSAGLTLSPLPGSSTGTHELGSNPATAIWHHGKSGREMLQEALGWINPAGTEPWLLSPHRKDAHRKSCVSLPTPHTHPKDTTSPFPNLVHPIALLKKAYFSPVCKAGVGF